MTSTESIKALVAKTLRVPLARIGDDAHRNKLRGWDSLGHVALVMAIEQQFSVSLTQEEILRMTSIREILEVLGARAFASTQAPDSRELEETRPRVRG